LNDTSIIFDDLIAAAHRVHVHTSDIDAAAKARTVYGYNAAQARGQVTSSGQRGPKKAVDD